MSASAARREAVREISRKTPVHQTDDLQNFSVRQNYGEDVFNEDVMRVKLPPSVFKEVQRATKLVGPVQLTLDTANHVANAMKDWAVEKGATHFTHWFQPMTGLTAEKHDAFLGDVPFNGKPLLEFSGKALIKGEPDASSFPNGGLRSTFEARGYTVWDPVSPAFIRRYENGTVLCIPTGFISWTGEALDHRTPLLRSEEALSREAVRMLRFIDETAGGVYSTLGAEQEFFMIDRAFFLNRPDLVATGRTLLGADPPKGQEMEDHYFGAIHPRVMACLQELEKQAWRLGVPLKTRHNEVSPAQHELAPIFERAPLACDHNMLVMELLRDSARRHGMECLLHEKPFRGVNGSGKHNNWSMCTTDGENLLEPGSSPHTNLRFILFLAAVIKAVDQHADVLRASIATASNDHRLGACEAPPAIISIFLGTQLENVVDNVVNERDPRSPAAAGPEHLELGVSTLPKLPRDQTDRNRTSPFAFTGNKFEFRAVGSSGNCAVPVTALNTAVANALSEMSDSIETKLKAGMPQLQAIRMIIVDTLRKHRRILFGGNGYGQEWRDEAERRGLLNLPSTPDALIAAEREENVAMFTKHKVFSRSETESRFIVNLERYCHTVMIEANTTLHMAQNHVLPAAMKQQGELSAALQALLAVNPSFPKEQQMTFVMSVADKVNRLLVAIAELRKVTQHTEGDDSIKEGKFCREIVLPAMTNVRDVADSLEELMDDTLWPLPKYHEMLFLR